MATVENTPRIYWLPAVTGAALLIAATAMLLETAYLSNHWDVAHLTVPILTISTCVAGVLAHHAICRFQLRAVPLIALALLGSVLCILNTLSRTAVAKDDTEAATQATNRTYGEKVSALEAAKVSAKAECKTIGKRCEAWNARVDQLTRELSGITVKSIDPQADAIVRIAVLVGFDGPRTRAIVTALQPAALPTFLELGAIVLLGVAFPHRRRARVQVLPTIAEPSPAILVQSFTKADALRDFRKMGEAGSGVQLSRRWAVHPATVSRWLSEWKAEGAINRHRDGKAVRSVLALPAPARA